MRIFNGSEADPDIKHGMEQYQNTPGAVLIDVRSTKEYAGGHIPESVNIPLNQIDSIHYPKSTPIFVYCQSGIRGGSACKWLNQHGFHAINIGGMMNYRGAIRTGGNR